MQPTPSGMVRVRIAALLVVLLLVGLTVVRMVQVDDAAPLPPVAEPEATTPDLASEPGEAPGEEAPARWIEVLPNAEDLPPYVVPGPPPISRAANRNQ